MMDNLLYFAARSVVFVLQAFPLTWVARLGRLAGALAFALDGRHRRIALENIAKSFPDTLSPAQVQACAREHFRRLGENYCSAIKTASMTKEALALHLEVEDNKAFQHWMKEHPGSCVIGAIGHFGNFELYARFGRYLPGFRTATTYRGLRQAGLNRLMQSLRARSGCLYFERRTDAAALREALARGGLLLGLLADQHAGDRGIPLPFLGRLCSTSAAPAVLALRYNAPLIVAICYRVSLCHWRIEFSPFIPTLHGDGSPRPVAEIMSDVNRCYEQAIRRDPANWFWVHKRWKPGKHRKSSPSPGDDADPTASAEGAALS